MSRLARRLSKLERFQPPPTVPKFSPALLELQKKMGLPFPLGTPPEILREAVELLQRLQAELRASTDHAFQCELMDAFAATIAELKKR